MVDLHQKIGGWAVTSTVVIMFVLITYLSPLIANATTMKQLASIAVGALTTVGVYKSVLFALFLGFKKAQWIRRRLLGDAFLEGTWVGHYQHGGLNRFTIETISQVDGETRISGREFDEHLKTRADWSSETAVVDLRH